MNSVSTSGVRMPAGFQVESDTTHRSENRMLGDHTHDGGVKDRLHHLRSRGMERLSSLRCEISDRVSSLKPLALDRINSVQAQMRSNPGKWAGIAAGAGLGIGLLGRLIRRRMRTSDLTEVFIVGAC